MLGRPLSSQTKACSTGKRAAGYNVRKPPPPPLPVDDLCCEHFGKCQGCSLSTDLHHPPIVDKARDFLTSRGFTDYQVVPGTVHAWRCRAKLAVRGKPGAPEIGLFRENSHKVVAIPDCRAHHPRINEATQLLQQVTAALRIPPYCEESSSPQQQQQQPQKRQPAGSAKGKLQQGGFLRYVQLTAVSSSPSGRAEEDAEAQIQLVLVWAAPDASHPSVADARQLAAALWGRGGPREPSPLALLRARAELKAAAGTNSSSSKSSKSKGSPAKPKQWQSSTASAPAPAAAGTSVRVRLAGGSSIGSSSSSSGGGGGGGTQGNSGVPLLHSVFINFQPDESSNKILGDSWLLLHGPQFGWQQFGGVGLALAPGSFVQANYGAMQRCLAAIAAATPSDASVLELYAGSGVIGLSLAAAGAAAKVVCVEVNPESSAAFGLAKAELGKQNAAAAAGVSHHVASAADVQLVQQLLNDSRADVMIVDPPRKGLDKPLLQLLTEPAGENSSRGSDDPTAASREHHSSHLKRIIYLSCGFSALTGDADALLSAGWQISSCSSFFFLPRD